VDRRIAPSTRIEEAIEAVLLDGISGPDQLSQLGRLDAQLILQRAVEEEVAIFLGWSRYERTPDAAGSRNGTRPRRVQTAEGEIAIAMPQVRDTLTRFVSSVIPDSRGIVRTRPLEALVIGAYVRGLSDRDIESLAREAGLGTISKTTVSTICRELRDRYRAFRARSLGAVRLLVRMLDAISICPSGPMAPRRASSSPGASRPTASGSCSMSASASGSGPRTGSTSGGASSPGVCGVPCSSSPTGHPA
jgi:putative transposase